MNSVILTTLSRTLFGLMIAISLWILFRGHNAPGGGFIGGLVAAGGYAVIALATGTTDARRLLIAHPIAIVGAGVGFAIASGIPGIVQDASFLTHKWTTLMIGSFELKLGTTMIFDLGVYLVVVGSVLALLLRLYEEAAR